MRNNLLRVFSLAIFIVLWHNGFSIFQWKPTDTPVREKNGRGSNVHGLADWLAPMNDNVNNIDPDAGGNVKVLFKCLKIVQPA